MSFECFMNELPLLIEYYYKKGEEKEQFAEKIIFCLKEFENFKASINSRLLTIHQLIFEKGYEKDKQVYQNFNDLLLLRNEITHLKAKDKFSIDKDGKIDHKISSVIDRLTSARIIDGKYKYYNDNLEKEVPLPFIELISQKKVAQWACNTICNTIDELVKSMPESELKTYMGTYSRIYWEKV